MISYFYHGAHRWLFKWTIAFGMAAAPELSVQPMRITFPFLYWLCPLHVLKGIELRKHVWISVTFTSSLMHVVLCRDEKIKTRLTRIAFVFKCLLWLKPKTCLYIAESVKLSFFYLCYTCRHTEKQGQSNGSNSLNLLMIYSPELLVIKKYVQPIMNNFLLYMCNILGKMHKNLYTRDANTIFEFLYVWLNKIKLYKTFVFLFPVHLFLFSTFFTLFSSLSPTFAWIPLRHTHTNFKFE